MLGTLTEAEEALQETFARLTRHGLEGIDDVCGWLVTVAARVCLDRLRADRSRAHYIGPWLPTPIIDPPATGVDPADRVTLDDSVRLALLMVLERLSPAERVVFVLHDVFGYPFEHVAGIVGRTPAACRKLASRARAALRDNVEPRVPVKPEVATELARRFADACATGDLDALLGLLDPNAVGEFDSGGLIYGAPVTAQVGAHLVAATLIRAFTGSTATFSPVIVNTQPGVTVTLHGRTVAVIALDTDNSHILAVHAVGNPDKLTHLNQ